MSVTLGHLETRAMAENTCTRHAVDKSTFHRKSIRIVKDCTYIAELTMKVIKESQAHSIHLDMTHAHVQQDLKTSARSGQQFCKRYRPEPCSTSTRLALFKQSQCHSEPIYRCQEQSADFQPGFSPSSICADPALALERSTRAASCGMMGTMPIYVSGATSGETRDVVLIGVRCADRMTLS